MWEVHLWALHAFLVCAFFSVWDLGDTHQEQWPTVAILCAFFKKTEVGIEHWAIRWLLVLLILTFASFTSDMWACMTQKLMWWTYVTRSLVVVCVKCCSWVVCSCRPVFIRRKDQRTCTYVLYIIYTYIYIYFLWHVVISRIAWCLWSLATSSHVLSFYCWYCEWMHRTRKTLMTVVLCLQLQSHSYRTLQPGSVKWH